MKEVTDSFRLVRDSFRKAVISRDAGKRWYDDNSILHIDLIDFLMETDSMK